MLHVFSTNRVKLVATTIKKGQREYVSKKGQNILHFLMEGVITSILVVIHKSQFQNQYLDLYKELALCSLIETTANKKTG